MFKQNLLGALALFFNATLQAQPTPIQGNGNLISTLIPISPFEKLVVSGPIDVSISNSRNDYNCKYLHFSIDENLRRYAKLKLEGGTLYLALEPNIRPSAWPSVTTDCDNLVHLRAEMGAVVSLRPADGIKKVWAYSDNAYVSIAGTTESAFASASNGAVVSLKLLEANFLQLEAGDRSFVAANKIDDINTSIHGSGAILLMDKNQSKYRTITPAPGVTIMYPTYYHDEFASRHSERRSFESSMEIFLDLQKQDQ